MASYKDRATVDWSMQQYTNVDGIRLRTDSNREWMDHPRLETVM